MVWGWLYLIISSQKNTDSHPYVLLNSFIFCPQLYLFDSGYSLVVLGKDFLSGGRGESIRYYKMFFSPNIAYHFFTTIKLIYTLVYQCLNSYFFSVFWNMNLYQTVSNNIIGIWVILREFINVRIWHFICKLKEM